MSSADPEKAAPPAAAEVTAPKAEAPPSEAPRAKYFAVADVILRVLLFASTLTAVLVMVTSKQTELAPIPVSPFVAPSPAKFNHSPSFIYFVAALSVAGFYSIISSVLSFLELLKPACSTKLLSHFVIFDVLLLGIVAAATGAAGGVAYIGLKGNSHNKWQKVCNIYDEFCRHLAASIAVSLFASIVLLLLVLLSVYNLSKKIPRRA